MFSKPFLTKSNLRYRNKFDLVRENYVIIFFKKLIKKLAKWCILKLEYNLKNKDHTEKDVIKQMKKKTELDNSFIIELLPK